MLDNNAMRAGATVLVTGGTGFVGAYVIRDLVKAGYKVKAIRRKPTVPAFIQTEISRQVQWIDCDILDIAGLESAMENTDTVIHSAAVVSFNPEHKRQMFATNVEGTENIVNAALEKNVRRFVHVSSVATLGKKKDGSVVTEKSTWQESKLNTNYAISKNMAEMHVWRGIAEGLNGIIVNPSTILGYGDWNTSSNALFRNVYDGFKWYSSGGTGFVDVEDVSAAIVQLMATNIHSERFILNGENWSYKKLLDTIADGFKKSRPSLEATPFLAGIAWRFEKLKSLITGKKILLSRESATIAQSNTKFDNSKILAALPGFRFTNLEHTIQNACLQYATQKILK